MCFDTGRGTSRHGTSLFRKQPSRVTESQVNYEFNFVIYFMKKRAKIGNFSFRWD